MSIKSVYGDPELIRWLNREIKLFPAIIDIEKQFQNWFYFQEILYKTGNPLKKILVNKFDEYATQQNIKIVKKHIIKLVGIEPKVEKGQSMIEEYLKAIKSHAKPIPVNPLLTVARQDTTNILGELTKTLKVVDKKQVQSLVNNYEEKFINSLPKKLKTIEDKMHKFRDEKIIHEIQAVKLKQKDEEKEKEWLQSLRQNELEKIRANHEFIKDQDKKIYQFWRNTEQIKHNRIEKETKFNAMMTNRLKDTLFEKKSQDQKEMDENIHLFLQTCIRQGIEIEKDPSKKPVPEKAKFSAVATMMKIRERTHKTEEARKARQKRRNKLLVEQVKQQELVEAKKKLEELVDKFADYGKNTNADARQRHTEKLRGNLQIIERKYQCEELETQKEKFFDQLRLEAKAREQDLKLQRLKEWRILQVQYMEQNYNRKVQKRQKHIQQMQPLILTILDLADKCYLKMNEGLSENTKPLTLDKKIWIKLIEEWQTDLCQIKPIQDHVIATITQDFIEYYHAVKDWKATQNDNQLMANISLAEFLFDITDELYPMQPLKEGINFYLPLKISLIGGKFSGRRTTAKFLNQKYGLEIIDIEATIKEALKLAFPPVEDPKKKKDTKKVIEVPVIENPELKEYGLEINEYKDQVIPDELLLKGILIKLNQTFGQRTPQQVVQEIREARELQQKKEAQPAVEEVKKVSKKPGKKDPVQATGPSLEDLIKEYLNAKQFYYTKGWVMVGFPETYQQAKMLEEQLKGFIPYEERLNQTAEEKKKKFQELLDLPTQEDTNKLQQSGTDLIIHLDVPMEQRLSRMQNRRIDPATEIIYNLEENLPPPEIKLDKLLKVEGETEEKLQKDVQQFSENLPALIEWCEQFGFEEEFKLFHVIAGQPKGYEVAKSLDPIINKALSFNLQYLNQLADEITIQESQQQDQQSQMHQEQDEAEKVMTEQNQDHQSQQDQEKQNLLDAKQSTEKGRSQMASRQKDGQNDFLNQDQLLDILKQWDEISNTYIRESTIYIRRMTHQRKKCQQIFLQTQKQFVEFFESPDTKLKLLHEYQQNYNKFLQDNDDLSKQKNAKQQLKEHLQKTYEQLWDILNFRKNEALEFVKKLKKERFVAIQIQQFMQHVLMLLQTETNLLTEIQLLGKPWSEHFILEPPQSELIQGYKFPQLDVLISYYNDCLDKITAGEESLIIKIQKEIAFKRGQIIRSVAYSKMTEMLLMEDILYSKIDDWIICGIKQQNDFCFDAVNYLKKQIDDRQPAVLTIPEPSPISESFKLAYIQHHLIPEEDKWRLIIQFYEELKSLSDTVWIPRQNFQLFARRRNNFITKYKINIEKVQAIGSQRNDNYFSYQILLIIIILYDCRVPTQDEIQQVYEELHQVEPEDQRDYFIDYQFWFDDGFADKEYNEKLYIKNFLFNILQSSNIATSFKENFMQFNVYENQLFSSIFEEEITKEETKNDTKK